MKRVNRLKIFLDRHVTKLRRTFAWIVILGPEGIVNNAMIALGLWNSPASLLYTWHGTVVALVQIQLPLIALPIINSLLRIDPNLISAAGGLGGEPLPGVPHHHHSTHPAGRRCRRPLGVRRRGDRLHHADAGR
jgi:hypothetical protein